VRLSATAYLASPAPIPSRWLSRAIGTERGFFISKTGKVSFFWYFHAAMEENYRTVKVANGDGADAFPCITHCANKLAFSFIHYTNY
jgi:hypothetical protein